ncbi:MAG: condensation domain-containing protein [Planctomycetota bacterium]
MENVEDLVPLSPMQRVMLLRALSTAGQESLFQQFRYDVVGDFDPDAFRAAWRRALLSHTSLRTAIVWKGLRQPLQVVRKDVDLPYRYSDVSQAGTSRSAAVERQLQADRAEGFDLTDAPLVRIHVLRHAAEDWTILWSSHHLVLDRWSIAPLLGAVWQEYARLRAGQPAAASAMSRSRFRDYVAWIERQDSSRADAFWAERLSGLAAAHRRLALPEREPATAAGSGDASFALEAAPVRRTAQALRVTPGAVLQAAWALTLAGGSAANAELTSRDVAFGVTVSGRPPGVPGIEGMVGTFIGNVPVRATLDPASTVRELCAHFLREGQARLAFEYVSPGDLHRLAGLPAGEPLFDSLFVWLAESEVRAPEGLEVRPVPGPAVTALPWTVSVLESGESLEVSLRSDGSRLAGGLTVDVLASRLRSAALALIDAPDAKLGDRFRFAELDPALDPLGSALPLRPSASARPDADAGDPVPPGGREFDDPTMLEELVLKECEELLGNGAPPDRSLGFFDQGGTSMLAAQLHARLEALTGRALPLLELFEAPTLDGMIEEITSKPWPLLGGVLRAVRPEGSSPPLFCVSSPEVNSLGYVTLARHLRAEQPVYLAQGRPAGTDAVFRMAVSDIPKLAQDTVDAMVERFPEGPYRIFGMCDGALVAMEIARRLRESGREVEFLCLLNTYALGTLSRRYKFKRAVTRATYYRERIQSLLGEKLRGGDGPAPEPTSDQEAVPGSATEDGPTLAERLEKINGEWFEYDTPRHLPARPIFDRRIVVLRNTAQPYWRIRDKALGWGAYSSDVEVVDLQAQREAVEGPERRGQQDAHMALLREPDIAYVARAINERLAALDGAAAATSPGGGAESEPAEAHA